VLLAMLLATCLRKFGKFTVPQFICGRFCSKSASTVEEFHIKQAWASSSRARCSAA
jgi:Na+(H+)/acetate symporter ActP